jgi:hypothetical protein
MYACFYHAIACYAGVEGAFRMAHHLTSEVDCLSRMICSWAREASLQTLGNLQFNAHILGSTYIG